MALEIRGVTVTAGRALLIENVSLTLEAGKLTVILGANGAGKSTALGVLAGDIQPSGGDALLDGAEITSLPPRELAARRAVVLQQAPLNFSLQVHEVVALSHMPYATRRKEADAVEARALAALGLIPLVNRDYATLSGGERQRVQIARALAQLWHHADGGRTGYLLMDEPTAHLDLKHQIIALEAARNFADSGGAGLCILHDLALAREFSNEVVLLKNGVVVASGDASRLLTSAMIAELYDIPDLHAERFAVLC